MSEVNPSCFGNPAPCDACASCGVRAACYESNAGRPVYLLPKRRPVVLNHTTRGGATLAVEVVCSTCGPSQKMWIDGRCVCSQCKQPLEN
jgi:hypothetical protein